jgi:hypothetical protein
MPPFLLSSRCTAFPLALAMLLACGGCRKSDAERAAEERAKIEERIRDSTSLVPYRALKLTARAQGTAQEPEAVTALWKMLEQTRELPGKEATAEQAALAAESYLKLAIAFYRARETLRTHDEDDYPLLWRRLGTQTPTPLPGYDAGMEHLFMGAVLVALDTADQGNKVPATELTLYEFSRATPRAEWPGVLRTGARAGRGLSFMQGRYHYAAEEELTAYLEEVKALPEDALTATQHLGTTVKQERESLLAAGYFLRAWNRMQLDREEPAADDVELGLGSLDRLGVENELTWWGWAFVHTRRERYAEAATNLDKLAGSPYVDESTRQELRDNAQLLREHGGRIPLFRQQRAALVLVRALVARAGGLEKILIHVLGEEQARRVYAPLVWMDRVRQGVAEVKTEEVMRQAGGVLDKARQMGREGLSSLKEKLDAVGKGTADSGPP